MSLLRLALCLLLSHATPMKKGTVFFDSFHGQYNDNPKYISEKLHALSPETPIVWCRSEKGHDAPPPYVKCVKYDTLKYYDYAFNSEVVVDNNIGIRTLGFKKRKSILLEHLVKKKGQLCISTWHGTPLKRIGKDQTTRKTVIYYTSTNYMVSGCDYHTKQISEAFYLNPDMIRNCGMPRNDPLFWETDKKALKTKLGLPTDRAVVLFAPTFRDSVTESGIRQLNDLDIDQLLEALEERFHKNFVFAFRVHHTVLKEIEALHILRDRSSKIYDGNLHDDMAEYLSAADVLITDYSGSMIDAAIISKPCFLYIPDYYHYRDKERGFYIDYDLLPFPKALQADMLYKMIRQFDMAQYRENICRFNQYIGNNEKGTAAEYVAKDIIKYIREKQFLASFT